MNIIQQFFILIFPILFALTIHEFSHGYAAYKLGDDTAKRAGRLTLNPLKHLDLFGTIIFPLLLIISKVGFVVGWAKPVPINPYNFKNLKRDTAIVSFAGPLANFISAIAFSIIFNLLYSPTASQNIFIMIIFYTIFINIALGLFNLIPIPPLDGSKIFGAFLPDNLYYKYQQFERKGMFLFIGIILISNFAGLNIVGSVILPPIRFFVRLLTGVSI